jgi:hypothetical protein
MAAAGRRVREPIHQLVARHLLNVTPVHPYPPNINAALQLAIEPNPLPVGAEVWSVNVIEVIGHTLLACVCQAHGVQRNLALVAPRRRIAN